MCQSHKKYFVITRRIVIQAQRAYHWSAATQERTWGWFVFESPGALGLMLSSCSVSYRRYEHHTTTIKQREQNRFTWCVHSCQLIINVNLMFSVVSHQRSVLRSRLWVNEVTAGETLGFQSYDGSSRLTGVHHHGNWCWTVNLLQSSGSTPRPLTNQITGNKESSFLQDPDMDKSPELQ